MSPTVSISLVVTLTAGALVALRAYLKSSQRFLEDSHRLDQVERKRRPRRVAAIHFVAVTLAFACLMPLVGLHPIWALAVRPITIFGTSAVVGALLIVLKFVFKIPWAKMVFKEGFTWKKCVLL